MRVTNPNLKSRARLRVLRTALGLSYGSLVLMICTLGAPNLVFANPDKVTKERLIEEVFQESETETQLPSKPWLGTELAVDVTDSNVYFFTAHKGYATTAWHLGQKIGNGVGKVVGIARDFVVGRAHGNGGSNPIAETKKAAKVGIEVDIGHDVLDYFRVVSRAKLSLVKKSERRSSASMYKNTKYGQVLNMNDGQGVYGVCEYTSALVSDKSVTDFVEVSAAYYGLVTVSSELGTKVLDKATVSVTNTSQPFKIKPNDTLKGLHEFCTQEYAQRVGIVAEQQLVDLYSSSLDFRKEP